MNIWIYYVLYIHVKKVIIIMKNVYFVKPAENFMFGLLQYLLHLLSLFIWAWNIKCSFLSKKKLFKGNRAVIWIELFTKINCFYYPVWPMHAHHSEYKCVQIGLSLLSSLFYVLRFVYDIIILNSAPGCRAHSNLKREMYRTATAIFVCSKVFMLNR